jgi:hypothetical protein
MSALDATTKEFVFTSLLGPYLLLRKNSKTFIIGTNALYHLSSANHKVVSVAKGLISRKVATGGGFPVFSVLTRCGVLSDGREGGQRLQTGLQT